MFFHTHTADSPWTVVRSNDKKRARLNCMKHFLSQLDYPDRDEAVAQQPDPEIVLPANTVVRTTGNVLAASLTSNPTMP